MKTKYLMGFPIVEMEINNVEFEALLDTGFNGSIMLPLDNIEELGLKRVGFINYILADGNVSKCATFKAEISWLGKPLVIDIASTESNISLIGMELLNLARTTLEPSKDIIKIEESK